MAASALDVEFDSITALDEHSLPDLHNPNEEIS
jgi:hypothetical protein